MIKISAKTYLRFLIFTSQFIPGNFSGKASGLEKKLCFVK